MRIICILNNLNYTIVSLFIKIKLKIMDLLWESKEPGKEKKKYNKINLNKRIKKS